MSSWVLRGSRERPPDFVVDRDGRSLERDYSPTFDDNRSSTRAEVPIGERCLLYGMTNGDIKAMRSLETAIQKRDAENSYFCR